MSAPKTLSPLREMLSERLEGTDALLLEPEAFDEAILGITERADGETLVAYSREKVIEVLMKDGMDRDDAEEFYNFNTVGAWAGKGTPIFVTSLEDIF